MLAPRALLGRILDQPDLQAQIESLPPALLGKLVDRIGLEDAGEILSLTSTEQLAQLFDDDLWKNERPGEVEKFDAERFLLWLEVMLEAGEAFVANKLVDLPEDLVTLALHRHVLVIDIDALATEVAADEEEANSQLEKALESALHEELGEYRLIARRHDGWDTLMTAVLALDRDHHDHLWRILERCCHMSAEHIEENGCLYEVLTSEEMLEADVAGEREDRRAESGYVSPSTASSFLKLARTDEGTDVDTRDPVTRAYFRNLSRTPIALARGAAGARDASRTAALPGRSGSAAAGGAVPSLQRVLAEAGLTEESQVGRLLSAGSTAEEPLLVRAMRLLGETHPGLFGERSEELAYLANVLVSGASFHGRRFRPIEALRAVIATCSLGLHLATRRALPTDETVQQAATCLEARTADALFRLAHHHLHREVVRRAKAAVERSPSPLDAPTKAAVQALAEDCPSLAGALLRRQDEARPETDDDPARFLTTPTELAAAIQFLTALNGAPPAPATTPAEEAPFTSPTSPPEKTATKKTVSKKTVSKKTVSKTSTKTAPKKTVPKKTVPKKTVPKKTAPKKTATPGPRASKRASGKRA